jgi:hypothetical protein
MIEHAPGAPGIPPTWTSSAKDMVGCALGSSRLWFTLGLRHRQRSLLSAGRHSADPRSRPHSRRRRRLLGRGQACGRLSASTVSTGRPGGRDRAPAPALFASAANSPGIAPRCSGNRVSARRRSEAAALCAPGAASGRHRLRQPCCDCLALRTTNLVGPKNRARSGRINGWLACCFPNPSWRQTRA